MDAGGREGSAVCSAERGESEKEGGERRVSRYVWWRRGERERK